MRKKPISASKGMFADGLAIHIVIEGFMIGSLALLAFVIGIRYYDTPAILNVLPGQDSNSSLPITSIPYVGRTMCFAVLSLSQLFHSFNMRSEHSLSEIGLFSNMKLIYSFIICTFLQMSVIMITPLAKIFQVVPLSLYQWAITLFLAFVPIIVIEIQKKVNSSLQKAKEN